MSRLLRINGIAAALILLSVTALSAQPVDTLTVMSYNVLNYPDAAETGRNDDLRKVIQSVGPDIIIVQEMWEEDDIAEFEKEVLTNREYLYPQRYYGTNQNVSIYYNRDKVQYTQPVVINPDMVFGYRPRTIAGYRFQCKLPLDTAATFWIFGAHLKAGGEHWTNEDTEDSIRYHETGAFVEHVNTNFDSDTHYMLAGDFNIYDAAEPAYQRLMNELNYPVFDPVETAGDWHSQGEFSHVHTQSTRGPNQDLGDGGSTGGLDDRFDFILTSATFRDTTDLWYIENTYQAYGNDGNHLNDAINEGLNSAVSPEIADALHRASDHLPVVAKFGVHLLAERGDVNTDGEITQEDVNLIADIILQEAPKPGSTARALADVNSDGTVDVRDIVVLMKKHSLEE